MLIVFSGLPGSGKTTIAQALACQLEAVYLRIDVIEQTLREAGVTVGANGYQVANALALSNVRLGRTVIADCVNPVKESRDAWKAVAVTADVALINIEVVCSDQQAHRRRVETRTGDIPGLIPPMWQSVMAHEYEHWNEPRLIIDTATSTASEATAIILRHLAEV